MKINTRLLSLTILASSLLFTACSQDDIKDKITNTNDSTEERIAKKDFIYIVKNTPESVCQSNTFLNAVEQAIESINTGETKVIKVKDLTSDTQSNNVTCQSYKPSDITDIIDPICEESTAESILATYDIPDVIDLNAIIDTACVVSADQGVI